MARVLRPISSRRLGNLLLLSSALTVLSFVVSTFCSQLRARGISRAAASIMTDAVPSLEHLSSARTELRHAEIALDDYIDSVVAGSRTDPLREAARRSMARMDSDWTAYTELPPPREPAPMRGTVEATRAGVGAAFDETLRLADGGQPQAAGRFLTERAKPAVNRLDDELRVVSGYNAGRTARLGAEIESLRLSSRSWFIVLDSIAALLATIAAILATTIVRRHARVMEGRVEELEMFAGRVAHDIRGPLTSVALALDVTKQKPSVGEEQRPAFDRARRTLQRVSQMVDGLLVFARAGGPPAEGATANVPEVLGGVLEEMRPAAAEKQVEIAMDADAASTVACSPGVLASLASNLIGNAIKYMGNATVRRVRVRARDRDSRMRLEVEDTGPGVPQSLRGRIFQTYARAAGSTTPGLGLGLATVRRLVEAHDGAVGLETPRVGARFWIELPRERHAGVKPRAPWRRPAWRGRALVSGS